MAFSTIYARFRGSKAFLWSLATFVFVWLLGHFTFGLDPTFGGLNLCLSIEASLSVALLIMYNEKFERRRFEQEQLTEKRRTEDMRHMLDMMEATKALLEENYRIIKTLNKLEKSNIATGKKIQTLGGKSHACSCTEKDCEKCS